MVLLSAQAMDVAQIARVTLTSEDRVREVIHNFNADGFEALYPRYRGGRPPTFTLPQRHQIKKVALSRPAPAPGGPLAPGMRLQVQGPELVGADHHARVPLPRRGQAVGDAIQLEHPVLLGLEVRVGRGLPGLGALEATPPARAAGPAGPRG